MYVAYDIHRYTSNFCHTMFLSTYIQFSTKYRVIFLGMQFFSLPGVNQCDKLHIGCKQSDLTDKNEGKNSLSQIGHRMSHTSVGWVQVTAVSMSRSVLVSHSLFLEAEDAQWILISVKNVPKYNGNKTVFPYEVKSVQIGIVFLQGTCYKYDRMEFNLFKTRQNLQ